MPIWKNRFQNMNCLICKTVLQQDLFGLFCPNESCCYISEMPNIANEENIIPLLYENEILIKWIKINYLGDKHWFLNGVLHREDGPAVEYSNGSKEWYLNGFLHREDGPAVEYANGYKEWWLNDKRHREDGPAIEYANGSKSWYINGKRHREDGPAVDWANGAKEWWVNGKQITEHELSNLQH